MPHQTVDLPTILDVSVLDSCLIIRRRVHETTGNVTAIS